MTLRFNYATTALLLSLFTCVGQAAALDPAATVGRPSGSIGLRYGSDDLNLGFGGRVGYTLDPSIYIGGMGEYFIGESSGGAGAEVSFSAWMVGVEAGYDLGLTPEFVLRPALLLAVVGVSGEACVTGFGCTDSSDTDVDFGLGAQALYTIGDVQVGGELRYMVAQLEALVLGVNLGLLF